MEDQKKWRSLTKEEAKIIIHKGTELPFSGEYLANKVKGTYFCKQCKTPLYKSTTKFDSGCGWPSFDKEIKGMVLQVLDGKRTEIICATCKGHLGHVFIGEGFTPQNTRHCVNSISLLFEEEKTFLTDTAVFASGCFWGTEYFFQKLKGVLTTRVGYIGGHLPNPNYKQVSQGNTGHYEAIEIIFDPKKINYRELVIFFFETHNPEQANGQGPDIGSQYLSAIFTRTATQKIIAQELIEILTQKKYRIATKILNTAPFWQAEKYHQKYYLKNGQKPYCHSYNKRF